MTQEIEMLQRASCRKCGHRFMDDDLIHKLGESQEFWEFWCDRCFKKIKNEN